MQPMLASPGDAVPAGAEWAHEVKWDGIRALVDVSAGGARVTTRNENDVTVAWPELQGLVALGRDLLLDGEIVSLGQGVPSLGALADRMHVRDPRRIAALAAANPITFLVFDLLRLDGSSLMAKPLRERRDLLEGLNLGSAGSGAFWQVPPVYDDGASLLAAAEQQGLEGVVSKRLSSVYRPGVRSRDWLKFPIRPTASFVVGGFRHETGSDTRVGSLLVGEPVPEGLVFRGRVGSGLAGRKAQSITPVLRDLVRAECPFDAPLPRLDALGAVWVEPTLVVDVQFLSRTRDGRLRQPAYRGVRTDLSPEDLEVFG